MQRLFFCIFLLSSFGLVAQIGSFPLKAIPKTEVISNGWDFKDDSYHSLSPYLNELKVSKNLEEYKFAIWFKVDEKSSLNIILLPQLILRFSSFENGILFHSGQKMVATHNYSRPSNLWNQVEITMAKGRLELVTLNGMDVFQNVFFTRTKAEHSIRLKSEGGLCEVKSLGYLGFSEKKPIQMEDLHYSVQETYDWDRQFAPKDTKPVTGQIPKITHELPHDFNRYKITFTATILAEEEGTYAFTSDYQGISQLFINDSLVAGGEAEKNRVPSTGQIFLAKGKHNLRLTYQKMWWRAGIGLFVSGPEFRPYAFHADRSLPVARKPNGIFIPEVLARPKLIRGFYMHQGEKRTETLHVGTPQKRHYTFDLTTGSLLNAWKGAFADVTEMWHERGEPQLFEPLGLGVGEFPLNSLFDDYMSTPIVKKYVLNEDASPIFQVDLGENKINRSFKPFEKGLEVILEYETKSTVYVVLGKGNAKKLSPMTYEFDTFKVQCNNSLNIRKVENAEGDTEYHLELPKGKSKISYNLIW